MLLEDDESIRRLLAEVLAEENIDGRHHRERHIRAA